MNLVLEKAGARLNRMPVVSVADWDLHHLLISRSAGKETWAGHSHRFPRERMCCFTSVPTLPATVRALPRPQPHENYT